jgi:hypothetical protein
VTTGIGTTPDYVRHSYWLSKMNKNGVFQWARTFGNLPFDWTSGKYIERDIAVCVDERDGIYITGGFDSTRQFGLSTFTSLGGSDCFVMKYDSFGTYKWATQAGSNDDDWANGICSDKDGNIYITGEHRDSLFMDTVMVKNFDKRDVFIFKINAQTGKPYWGKRAGSDLGSERGNDVWADKNCNVYVCGDINEGAKFGDSITLPVNGLGVQGFVARITPEGKWKWVKTGGGLGDDDRANGIVKGKGSQLYMAGFFRNAATYGSTQLTGAGSSDGFFIRMKDSMYKTTCITVGIEQAAGQTASLSEPVPNPSSGEAMVTYSLPSGIQSATISVFGMTGQLLQTYTVSNRSNSLRINSGNLPSGIYMYQLHTAGGVSEVRKMVVNR